MVIRRLSPILVLAILGAAPGRADAPRQGAFSAALDAEERVHHFSDVAVSPDGARVSFAERGRDEAGRERVSVIRIASVSAPSSQRLLSAADDGRGHEEHGAVWSPDGQTIAFLSDAAAPGQAQVYLARASGGSPRQLTHVVGQLADLRFAKDGRSLSFLFVEGSRQRPGALVAHAPDVGVVHEKIDEQRIAVADVASGAVRVVSPPDLYVYDYDWSPDGKSFAAEAARGSGTDNYWTAELYRVAVATGEARSIWKPPFQIACPRVSPDGQSVAVIHGLMSDEGSTGGDVVLVPIQGGEARDLTPGLAGSAAWLRWLPSGQILVGERVDGQAALASLDAAGGGVSTLWQGAEDLSQVAVASDRPILAFVRQSFSAPPEVWAGPVGSWSPVSRSNAGLKPLWGEAKSLHWQSDGFRVQGFLVYPAGFDPARTYPLVVVVHGGPSAVQTASWPSRWTLLASQGYFVFLPNPRGSYGQGEAFTQANVKDLGYGDLRDILVGVDLVVKTAPVSEARVGIVGWSYGGYMAMWAVTQTRRFAAAVAGAGIANWQSYYGENRIDAWLIPFFGASVYDDPEIYARSSPLTFIKRVRTPTLVLHGDRDSEVPTPQGYEFWHALKTLGVPTELVIYPDEGHAISTRAHRQDILKRSLEWFDRYLR